MKYLIPPSFEFCSINYARRLNTIINKSCFIPNEDSIICDDNEGSLRVGSSVQTQVCLEGIEIEDLEQTNKFLLRQQQETNQSIYKFTKAQTEIFQRQNELIQKSTNH